MDFCLAEVSDLTCVCRQSGCISPRVRHSKMCGDDTVLYGEKLAFLMHIVNNPSCLKGVGSKYIKLFVFYVRTVMTVSG